MKKLNQQHLLLSLLLLSVLMLSACRHDDTSKLMDKALDLQAQGKQEESVAALEQYVLGIRHETGDSSVQYAEGLFLLARGRANLREFQQADSLFNASEQLLAAHPEMDSLRAEVYLNHGIMKLVQDQAEVADELFDMGLNAIPGHYESCHPLRLKFVSSKASVRIWRPDIDAAISLLERYLACTISSHQEIDSLTIQEAGVLLILYPIAERPLDAKNLALKLIDQPDSIKSKHPRVFADVYKTLGAQALELGQVREATSHFSTGLQFAEQGSDSLSNRFTQYLRLYADAVDKSDDISLARSLYERAFRLSNNVAGADIDQFEKLAGEFIQFLRRTGDEQRAGEVELLINSHKTE